MSTFLSTVPSPWWDRVDWMLVFTGILAVTAIFGIIFLWRQVSIARDQIALAREQFEEAKRQIASSACDTAKMIANAAEQAKAMGKLATANEASIAVMLRQLEASERPWVAVSIAPRGPLRFDESGGAYVMLLLTLKNVGGSVATHMGFKYKLIANPRDVITEQYAIAKRIQPDASGEVLFPRERNREPIYCAVSKEDIERGDIMTDGDDRYVMLSIVGVVAYRFATSSDPHITRFAYRVGRVDSKMVLRGVKVGGELPPEEIHTTVREPGGSYAD